MEDYPAGGPPSRGSSGAPRRPRFGAGARRWRSVSLALGLIVATLLGVTGRLLVSDLNIEAFGSAGTPSPTVRPTAPPSLATVAPSPTPSPTATPTPTLPVITADSASVTFRDLMVDTSVATARTFSFTSDGQGSVSAEVIAAGPLNGLKLCVSVNEGVPACATGSTPAFHLATPPGDHADWVVTLVATKSGATPIVDVTFIWPTLAPSFTLTHGRFQGLPNPDSLRGFTLQFRARAAGNVQLLASWPPVTGKATLTMTDITTLPATKVGQASYAAAGSITSPYTNAVDANHIYQIVLQNNAADSGHPDLTAQISFP